MSTQDPSKNLIAAVKQHAESAASNAELSKAVFRWGPRSGVAFITTAAIGAISFIFASQSTCPQPVLYGRLEKAGDGQPVPPDDPRFEIKFGNVGNAPMFMSKLEIIDANGNTHDSIADALAKTGTNSFVVSSDSSKAMKKRFRNNHPYAAGYNSLHPMFTVRQNKNVTSSNWEEDFRKAASGVKVVVKYHRFSWAFMLSFWPFCKTNEFPLIPSD